ncbi:hypothetical protein APHAL10511_005542 [Amanita phalloides]|nr:hypothetical protein APHAL10511_005542 [Amanita phalloides]
MPRASKFMPRNIPCPVNGCWRYFTNIGGLLVHLGWHSTVWEAQQRQERLHQELQRQEQRRLEQQLTVDIDVPFNPLSDIGNPFDHQDEMELDSDCEPDVVRETGEDVDWHPKINGRPCDKNGNFLPLNAPPPPWEMIEPDDFSPFSSREAFVIADLLFQAQ